MKLIQIASVTLCAVLGSVAVASPKSIPLSQQREHQEWVGQSLTEMQTVKPGMTRSDLEKVFVGEGGLYSSTHRVYIYRGCSYFKVDVVFRLAGSGLEIPGNPKDCIVSITKPYINGTSQPN